MKKLFTIFLTLSGVSLLMFSSCKKNDALVVTKGGTAGTLSANTTTLVLDKSKLNDTTSVIKFTFTKPTYEYNAAVTNTLQIDVPGDNWGSKMASTGLSTRVYSQGFSTNDFNNLLLKLGLSGGVASQVNVRVQHSLGGGSTPIYSNTLTLTVTPFFLTSWVYVPGAYQGWNPATADSLVSATGNGIYTGVINFKSGNKQFLVNPAKNWANKYATNISAGPGATTASYPVTYNGSNNFTAPTTAGLYQVTLDLNANTLTIAPVAKYYSLIGDAAIDWGTDVDMKYINDNTGRWSVTTTLKSTGGFKIRENHAWSTSFGYLATPDGKTLTASNGGNMSVSTTGSYTVNFIPSADDKTGTYTVVQH
jgi:hypothetical protein